MSIMTKNMKKKGSLILDVLQKRNRVKMPAGSVELMEDESLSAEGRVFTARIGEICVMLIAFAQLTGARFGEAEVDALVKLFGADVDLYSRTRLKETFLFTLGYNGVLGDE